MLAVAVSRVVVVVREVCPSQLSWRWFEMSQYARRPARPLVSIAVSRAAYSCNPGMSSHAKV